MERDRGGEGRKGEDGVGNVVTCMLLSACGGLLRLVQTEQSFLISLTKCEWYSPLIQYLEWPIVGKVHYTIFKHAT